MMMSTSDPRAFFHHALGVLVCASCGWHIETGGDHAVAAAAEILHRADHEAAVTS